MWRHSGSCSRCGQKTRWERDLEESRDEITAHLQEAHGIVEPEEPGDYRIARERQCDYCLEPYLDHCTKCTRDFCALHAGDIDGLCGGCI